MDAALLLAAGLAVLAGLAWLSWKQAKERRARLLAFAASQGWTWTDRDDSWVDRFDADLFARGRDRRACNVLQGSYGDRPVVAFDYSYETHSTDSQGRRRTTTHRYAVAALRLPAQLPTLELAPEDVLTRIGGLLGLDDVELESEDFNRRYRVSTADPKFAYDVLHPRTMQALLDRQVLTMRMSGADALCWDDGRQSPAELMARLEVLAVLLDGIPSYVWKDCTPS